jgi:hypothetical protein
MSNKELKDLPKSKDRTIYSIAVINGCKPTWANGIFGWAYHCCCKNNTHGCDSQCSKISYESAKRSLPI